MVGKLQPTDLKNMHSVWSIVEENYRKIDFPRQWVGLVGLVSWVSFDRSS